MKTDQWPIEIDGKTYYVERTFSNNPAIYRQSICGYLHTHTHVPTDDELPGAVCIPDGQIVVFVTEK